MSSTTTGESAERERLTVSPPTMRLAKEATDLHNSDSDSDSKDVPAVTQTKPQDTQFETDLEDHPEDHFLSPVYGCYQNWSDDDDDSDDDDGDEVEWDAGIMDFALFDNDRRRASEEEDYEVPDRWDSLITEQQLALQRSIARNRANALLSPPAGDVPALTPDTSPNMRDDLDVPSSRRDSVFQPVIPNYLTQIVTPPSADQKTIADDDDLPLYLTPRTNNKRPRPKIERPGMQYNRTMSGKLHAWRHPAFELFPVREDAEGERSTENGMPCTMKWADEVYLGDT